MSTQIARAADTVFVALGKAFTVAAAPGRGHRELDRRATRRLALGARSR